MDGTVLIQALHQRYPDLLILAVSGHDETLYAAAALSAGAQGYIMKEDSIQIPEAIRRLRRGERYVSDQLRSEFDDLE
jgi:DNA-binding NarL/FixJ family response regulator